MKKFHTTATSGTLGAAATASSLLNLNADQFISALGTAGTQASGLWQFLLDAAHSKQVHTAQACAAGVFSAYTSALGLRGAGDILEGGRGMGATLGSLDLTPDALTRDLGREWAVLETSFKWHASCRHTHPSVDALLALIRDEGVKYKEIERITAYTYKAAMDLLGLSEEGKTVHQSKFSMGFVLAVAAKKGSAGLNDFTEEALSDPELRELQKRVRMVFDQEIDAAFPGRWLGRVEVVTTDGRTLSHTVDVVKGDPGWTLTRYVFVFMDLADCVGMRLSQRRSRWRSTGTSRTWLVSRRPFRGSGVWRTRRSPVSLSLRHLKKYQSSPTFIPFSWPSYTN